MESRRKIRETFGRYYSTQLSHSLNVGVREGQSLGISLGHRVNKGIIKLHKKTEGTSVKRKLDLALNMLGWVDIFSREFYTYWIVYLRQGEREREMPSSCIAVGERNREPSSFNLCIKQKIALTEDLRNFCMNKSFMAMTFWQWLFCV